MRKTAIYHLTAFAVVVVWGSTFVFSKQLLLKGLTPASIFTIRFVIAYVVMLALSPFGGRFRWFADNLLDELLMLGLGITGGSMYFLTENTALNYTSATNTSLIVCMCPLFAALLISIFYKSERLHGVQIVGTLMAALGSAIVVLNGRFVQHLSLLGDALAFGACLCWAVYSLLMIPASRKYDTLFITRKVFFYGLVSMIPYYAVRRDFPAIETIMEPRTLLTLLFLGCVASALCFFAWNWVIKKLGAVVTTNYGYFNPVVTMVFAWLLLSERITGWFLLGTALILSGMYLARRKNERRKEAGMKVSGPTTGRGRYVVLDALRGFALLGIALANFPEFGLWTFLTSGAQDSMATACIDHVVRFCQYLFVDGKFYTIFSVLFGIGFALILARHDVRLFYRRMGVLLVIGLLHLLFIWSGDILFLYAVGGLLLPLFLRLSDRTLLTISGILLMLPVALEAWQEWAGIDMAAPLYDAWWRQAGRSGITEENFATWLRDADSYAAVWEFLKQGAIERMWEFASGHRLPKVLGLFLIGYCIGRARLFARIDELRPQLRCMLCWTLGIGLPTSVVYAWSAVNGQPWGVTCHSLLYAVSVVPMGFAYMCVVCLWQKPFAPLRWAGRMALSCYIGQSVAGILLFYGIGLGLGLTFGLVHIELTALAVFVVEVMACRLWLRYFRFGPLEWVWRMLTYGRYIPLRQEG